MTEIKIPLSKTKLVLLLIGGLAFIFGGIWMIINSTKSDRYSEDFLFFIGIVCVLFFGTAVFFIVKKIISGKIGMIINDKGILDNSNSLNIGLMEWKDITGIESIKVKVPVVEIGMDVSANRMIVLNTDEPDKYIERQKNSIFKETLKYNYEVYGSPLTIISSGLKIKFSELENIISKQYNKSKS